MNRGLLGKYNRLMFTLAVFTLFTTLKAQQLPQNPSPYPNIIYILADDLGYGDISCYNEMSKLKTKNIDKLAENGALFTDAHTSSSVCTPTRYGILTGRYNWRSKLKKGVLSGYSTALIEPGRLTIGKLLQDKGYHTAFVGKWHLGWDWHFLAGTSNIDDLNSRPKVDFTKPIKNGPNEKGFDYSYGFSGSLDMPPYVYVENGQPTAIPKDTTVNVDAKGFWRKGITGPDFQHVNVLPHLTNKVIEYIEEQAKAEKPFFMYFALPAPHTPILPLTEFIGKSNTNFYGDFVLQVDDVMGRITKTLEDVGIREETMIVFTSDNGCSPTANFNELKKTGHNPNHIFRGYKADIYEGGHRVPFIVSWPNMIKETVHSAEVICTTDFMATVAEMLGYTLPENAGEDSCSFLSVITEKNSFAPVREAVVHHSIEGRFAIRSGDWKLILWPGSGGWSSPTTQDGLEGLPSYQLYNLDTDPSENDNLVEEYPEKVEELKTLLAKYVVDGRSRPGLPQKNDGPERWTELGWMDDFDENH